MNKFYIIFFIILFLWSFSPQKDPMYNKSGKPSSIGINYYVETNQNKIIKEFENFVKDTFFLDIEIRADNLEEYTGNEYSDLGYHYTYTNGTDEIVIDNRERYEAYDVNDLSKFKKLNLSNTNSFVKTVIIHELGHSYFLQNVILCIFDSIPIYDEYDFRFRIKMYPSIEKSYGALFIEEGISQYIIEQMHLQLPSKMIIPQSTEDLLNKEYEDMIRYGYSTKYLKVFLDKEGIKKGIRILIENKPPTYEEILKSELFFNRLEK